MPLALLADKKKFDVIGIEVSPSKLAALKKHQPIIDDEEANERLKSTKMTFTDDFSLVADRDIVIICVPTPVDEDKIPDLTLVKAASLSAAQHMKKGALLIVESTINPGVCDEVVIPLIEEKTDHVIGKTLYLAHCPERINPGDSR